MTSTKPRLSPREAQIAAMITHGGLSNKAIGKRLGISEKTVAFHVENISQKLPGIGRPRHKILVFFIRLESEQGEVDPNL